MNNGQNKTNRNLLDQQRTGANNQYQDFLTGANNRLNQASGNDQNLRNEIFDRYSNANNFMPAGMQPNSSGWFNLPGSNTPVATAGADFSKPKAGYQSMADTGGQDVLQPALDSYKGFMGNGGVGEDMANNMRYRATSAVPSFYNNIKNQMSQRSNVQGGYQPGFDSQMQELARQSGRATYDASRQAESDIADKILQGKEFGTTGYGNLAQTVNQNKLSGLGGLTNIGNSELGASEFNAGQNNQRYAQDQGFQQALAQMFQNSQFGAAQGLQGLYSSAPGATGQAEGAALSGMGGMNSNALNNLNTRASIKDNSWMNYLPGMLGAAGAAFTGFGGGSGAGINGGFTGGGSGGGGGYFNPQQADYLKNYFSQMFGGG